MNRIGTVGIFSNCAKLGVIALALWSVPARGEQHVITMTNPQIETAGYHIGVNGRLLETNENFVEDGLWVEAWWAQLDNPNTSQNAEFVSGHFHITSGTNWYAINHGHTAAFEGEYQGFFIETVDGRPFSLLSLDYRLLDNNAGEGTSFTTEILIGTDIDPLLPVEDQTVAFTVSSDPALNTLPITGFDDVSRVFVTCTLGPINEMMWWDNVVVEVPGCSDTAQCDDADACTIDACVDAECSNTAISCEDGNVCTDDSCDPQSGCMNVFNAAACDDGLPCTDNDTCSAGQCAGQLIPDCSCLDDADCNDSNGCTTDTCDAGTCAYAFNANACDDGDACTESDVCSNGACSSGSPLDCDDGNACTDDSCDVNAGCVNVDVSAACDDGLFCTGAETCDPAVGCVAGSDPCGGLPCDEAVDACGARGGPACGEIRNMRVECTANGAISIGIVLENGNHDGECLTVSVGGSLVDMVIADRIAFTTVCCPTGVTEVSLLTPANCVPSVVLNCGSDPIGACCLADESCVQSTQADCTGTYLGDTTSCSPGACTTPTGGCCLADDTCSLMTSDDCLGISGSYLGDNSTCDGTPCVPASGACCVGESCAVEFEDDCAANGGLFQGPDTICDAQTCVVPPIPCNEFRRIRARCLANDFLDVLVVLNNSNYDGQTVVVDIDGLLVEIPIVGRFAATQVCCQVGTITISMAVPLDCVVPEVVTCP